MNTFATEIVVNPKNRHRAALLTHITLWLPFASVVGAAIAHVHYALVIWAILMWYAGLITVIAYFTSETGVYIADAIESIAVLDGIAQGRQGHIEISEEQPDSHATRPLYAYGQRFVLDAAEPYVYELGRDAMPRFVYPGEQVILDSFPQARYSPELMVITDEGYHVLIPSRMLKKVD